MRNFIDFFIALIFLILLCGCTNIFVPQPDKVIEKMLQNLENLESCGYDINGSISMADTQNSISKVVFSNDGFVDWADSSKISSSSKNHYTIYFGDEPKSVTFETVRKDGKIYLNFKELPVFGNMDLSHMDNQWFELTNGNAFSLMQKITGNVIPSDSNKLHYLTFLQEIKEKKMILATKDLGFEDFYGRKARRLKYIMDINRLKETEMKILESYPHYSPETKQEAIDFLNRFSAIQGEIFVGANDYNLYSISADFMIFDEVYGDKTAFNIKLNLKDYDIGQKIEAPSQAILFDPFSSLYQAFFEVEDEAEFQGIFNKMNGLSDEEREKYENALEGFKEKMRGQKENN